MQNLPYFVMAGAALAALVIPLVAGGGAFWIVPLLAFPIIAAYAIYDRRQRRREDPRERLITDVDPKS